MSIDFDSAMCDMEQKEKETKEEKREEKKQQKEINIILISNEIIVHTVSLDLEWCTKYMSYMTIDIDNDDKSNDLTVNTIPNKVESYRVALNCIAKLTTDLWPSHMECRRLIKSICEICRILKLEFIQLLLQWYASKPNIATFQFKNKNPVVDTEEIKDDNINDVFESPSILMTQKPFIKMIMDYSIRYKFQHTIRQQNICSIASDTDLVMELVTKCWTYKNEEIGKELLLYISDIYTVEKEYNLFDNLISYECIEMLEALLEMYMNSHAEGANKRLHNLLKSAILAGDQLVIEVIMATCGSESCMQSRNILNIIRRCVAMDESKNIQSIRCMIISFRKIANRDDLDIDICHELLYETCVDDEFFILTREIITTVPIINVNCNECKCIITAMHYEALEIFKFLMSCDDINIYDERVLNAAFEKGANFVLMLLRYNGNSTHIDLQTDIDTETMCIPFINHMDENDDYDKKLLYILLTIPEKRNTLLPIMISKSFKSVSRFLPDIKNIKDKCDVQTLLPLLYSAISSGDVDTFNKIACIQEIDVCAQDNRAIVLSTERCCSMNINPFQDPIFQSLHDKAIQYTTYNRIQRSLTALEVPVALEFIKNEPKLDFRYDNYIFLKTCIELQLSELAFYCIHQLKDIQPPVETEIWIDIVKFVYRKYYMNLVFYPSEKFRYFNILACRQIASSVCSFALTNKDEVNEEQSNLLKNQQHSIKLFMLALDKDYEKYSNTAMSEYKEKIANIEMGLVYVIYYHDNSNSVNNNNNSKKRKIDDISSSSSSNIIDESESVQQSEKRAFDNRRDAATIIFTEDERKYLKPFSDLSISVLLQQTKKYDTAIANMQSALNTSTLNYQTKNKKPISKSHLELQNRLALVYHNSCILKRYVQYRWDMDYNKRMKFI
jgi:hypothetical protein